VSLICFSCKIRRLKVHLCNGSRFESTEKVQTHRVPYCFSIETHVYPSAAAFSNCKMVEAPLQIHNYNSPQVANAFAIVSAVKSNFISTLLLDLVQPFRWVFSSSKFFFYLFFLSPSCECGWSLFLVWFSIGLLSICFMVYTIVLNWCALFLKIIGRCMSLVIRRGACDYL
jgi:hypothetical protein